MDLKFTMKLKLFRSRGTITAQKDFGWCGAKLEAIFSQTKIAVLNLPLRVIVLITRVVFKVLLNSIVLIFSHARHTGILE